ncbi:MAG TPA: glycosyltransferase [Thermoleophilaceae bacterium]|nr:glycosyltransferase [Thermoleophilaceae bacterium]
MTVGTHEQPFDRLLREIDRLAQAGELPDEVFCQTGYTSYEPSVPHSSMLSYDEMQERVSRASLVVSHGGPGGIMPVLAQGKPLVLVPRRHRYGEHVDDHQVAFCRRLGTERGLPVVEDMDALAPAISRALARGGRGESPGAEPEAAVAEIGRRIGALLSERR